MILLAAAVLWLLTLLYVTFAPRLVHNPGARRNAQFDLLALGVLGLAVAGFFWQVLFTPNTYMPAGGGDLAGFLFPTYHFAQEWLTRGVIPLWNPYIFGGMPFVGDIQTALFYPPNLITYFLSNPLQYHDLEYLSVLHFYIAGAGMYAFLRFGPLHAVRPLQRASCLAGAVAFAFSDLFVTHFGNLNLIASASWLPLIFLFYSRALALPGESLSLQNLVAFRQSFLFTVLGGITLAVSFFAGHIQSFLLILFALALYTAFSLFINRARRRQTAIIFLATLAISASLGAITLLPALELARLSVRAAFTYQDAAQFSLPPIELVGMVVPGFFGRGPENAWGPWSRVEVGYLGILPLLLAALALIMRRSKETAFYALLSLVGLLLALGGYAILHGWLFQFIPGFGQLRAPARFVYLMDFGLAVLAAIGLDALLEPMTATARALLRRAVHAGAWLALLFALTGGALALGILILGQGQDPALFQRISNAANAIGFFILLLAFSIALLLVLAHEWLSPRLGGLLALALIFLDLFSLGAYVDVGHTDPTLGYQRADIVEFLINNTGLARIDSRTDVEGLWRPDTGLLYRQQDVYGDNPLVLNTFDTYWENVGGRDSPAYQLLNVKYVLTRQGTPMPSNFSVAFQGGGGITVWENRTTAPRAWLTTAVRQVDGGIELASGPPGTAGNTEIIGYSPNEITARVSVPAAAYLILSEVYAPGWRASVDGNASPVFPVNELFRAVAIPAGTHLVQVTYAPSSFQVGSLLSVSTAVLLLAALTWLLVPRRPPEKKSPAPNESGGKKREH